MFETDLGKKFEKIESNKIALFVKDNAIEQVKDLLEELAKEGKLKELEIVVFYCSKNQEKIQFKEELALLAEKNQTVQIIHVLTNLDEEQKEKWQGETGFIDRKMIKRYLDNEQDFFFIITGTTTFNQALKKRLEEELAIKEEMIEVESFLGY